MSGCILGFDVGTKWIGVAVGNRLTGDARAIDVVTVHDGMPDWQRFDHLVTQWQPDALVIGLPLAIDGGKQAMTRHARRFADSVRQRTGLPVHLHDERYTSQEAARRFAHGRSLGTHRRRDSEKIDAVAAAVILESWLLEDG